MLLAMYDGERHVRRDRHLIGNDGPRTEYGAHSMAPRVAAIVHERGAVVLHSLATRARERNRAGQRHDANHGVVASPRDEQLAVGGGQPVSDQHAARRRQHASADGAESKR